MEFESHVALQTRLVGLRRGLVSEVLHVTVTLCVRKHCGDFTTVTGTAGIRQRMQSKPKRATCSSWV